MFNACRQILRKLLGLGVRRFRMEPVGVLIQACASTGTESGLMQLEVVGKSYLEHQLDRVLVAFNRSDCVVVTTELKENRSVIDLCGRRGVQCYVGDRDDALGNCMRAARNRGFRSVVILKSDSPLIDPVLLVQMMSRYLQLADPRAYVGNRMKRSYPAGMEVEVTSVENLLESFLTASKWTDFADPTTLMRRGDLPNCRRVDVVQDTDQSDWSLRLDTRADHQRLSRLLGLVKKYTLHEVMTVAGEHGLLARVPRSG